MSTQIDSTKFEITLSDTEVTVSPGSAVQMTIAMTNNQDEADRLSVEIEGLDVEWYAMPVSTINLPAGGSGSERIQFRMSRSSENTSGTYPFVVRVQGLESGAVVMKQATLHIAAYHHIQMDISPRRARSSYFDRMQDFEVAITNLGNSEEILDLYASDSEDGCAFEYDTDRITLRPGQSETIPMLAGPKTPAFFGGSRLFGFTSSARSTTDAYVTANANGQIEKLALISPLFGIFVVLLAIGALAFWKFRPVPPLPLVIKDFQSTERRINLGQKVTLTWNVTPVGAEITLFHKVKKDGVAVASPGVQTLNIASVEVTPEAPVTIYILNVRDHGREKTREISIDVIPPPPPPKPVISSFYAEPAVVHLGEKVMLHMDYKNAKTLILDPGNTTLSPFEHTKEYTPTGDMEFSLNAIGGDTKDTVSKKTSVKVVSVDTCIAEIKSFGVQPAAVIIGSTAKLTWQTSYARKLHIDSDKGLNIDVTPSARSKEVSINEPTTFIITATDSAGKTTSKTLSVVPSQAPPPVTETPLDAPTYNSPPPPGDQKK